MLNFEKDSNLVLKETKEYDRAISNLRIQNTIQENEIDSKFLELNPHPSTKDLCGFASIVYEKEKKDLLWDDYVLLIEGRSKAYGYEGALFYSKKSSEHHHQLIIAHRGTNLRDTGSLQADYDGVANNRLTPQINSACTFALECVSRLCSPPHNVDQSGLDGHIFIPAQISITGHSLGGWLAQVSAFAVKYLTLNGDQFQISVDRGNKFHPHVEVFDSPGAYQIISKIRSIKRFCALKLQSVNFGLDISNFVLSPNIVNVVNEHVGDMFLLKDKVDEKPKPTKFFSKIHFYIRTGANFNNTHPIKFFVENLKGNLNSDPPIQPNPHPRQYRVEEKDWILVIFRNYDTKNTRKINKRLNVVTLVPSVVNLLLSNIWTDATSELENYFRSGRTVLTSTAGEQVLRINMSSLSRNQHRLIESCRIINVWRKYFGGSGSELPSKLQILQPILDIISTPSNDRNELVIPNQRDFNTLQNCGLIFPLIEKWCDTLLDDFEMAHTRCNSEKYINEMMDTFINLDFESDSDTDFNEVYRSSSPSLLKLFRFKICSWISQKKCGVSLINSLFLRYGDVPNFENLAWIPNGIRFIFVDCTQRTNHDMMVKYDQSIYSPSEKCRFIPIIWDSSAKGKLDLQISRSCYGTILKQHVNLQGASIELEELVGERTDLVMSCLFKHPDKLALLLQKQGAGMEASNLLEIGSFPTSIFDNINMYVEPCREFSSLEKAVKETLFKYESIGATKNSGKLIIYEIESSPHDLEGLLKNCIPNETDFTNSVTILYVDADKAETYFQQFCKENPSSVVALVEFQKSDSIIWKRHYNPDLYQGRIVIPPPVDIASIVNHPATTRNDALEIQSEQGSRLQLLSLNCAKIEDKSVLQNNLKVLLPSVNMQVNNLKSVDFKSGADGSCEIILYQSSEGNGDSRTPVEFKTTRQIPENELYRPNETGISSRNRSLLCISDKPGMGKTFSMITLANNILRHNTSKNWNWVFFIQLKELQKHFKVINEEGITKPKSDNEVETVLNKIVSFFSSKLPDQFGRVLLRNMMGSGEHSSKLYFVLDGFDELSVKEKGIMSKVLNFLTLYTSINMAVSTRTRDNLLVEKALGVLSHHLLPLEKHKHAKFLFNIWRGIIPKASTTCGKKKLTKFCSTLMKKVDDSFTLKSVQNEQFLGIPLHLKLLSISLLKSAEDYCSDLLDIDLEKYIPAKYSLGFLLDNFVETRYTLYFNKFQSNDDDMKSYLKRTFDRKMEFLASTVLQLEKDSFDELMWEMYKVNREEDESQKKVSPDPFSLNKDGIYKVGIVHLVDGRPEFLHRSIAEYYVANVIFHCFKKLCSSNRQNLKEKLFKICKVAIFENDRRLVRSFLNQRMCNDEDFMEIIRKGQRQGVDFGPGFPLIAPGGVDDAILNCFYEMARNEYNSPALLRFVVNSFINWEYSRFVFLIMCLTTLSVYPLTSNTLESVAILVHCHILRITEESSQSLVELVKFAPDLCAEFGIIKDYVTLPPDNQIWCVFRRDIKPVLEKEWTTLGFEKSTREILNKEMEESLERKYKIEKKEFEIFRNFVVWVYQFMQKLGQDIRNA